MLVSFQNRIYNFQNSVRQECLEPLTRIFQKVQRFFAACLAVVGSYFSFSPYRIVKVDAKDLSSEMQKKLQEFEEPFTYPYGEEQFRIIHGLNMPYGQFFADMGKAQFYLAIDKKTDQIAAMGCRVLRDIPSQKPGKTIPSWYLCDLKVGKAYQGKHLPMMLFARGMTGFFRAPRGYAVCMNPEKGEPPVVKIWKKHGFFRNVPCRTLDFYTFSKDEIDQLTPEQKTVLFKDAKPRFRTNRGRKDFKIFAPADPKKTRDWQLLHIQRGPFAKETNTDAQEGADHMICAIRGSSLANQINNIAEKNPAATATVLSMGMEEANWEFLLSNEV